MNKFFKKISLPLLVILVLAICTRFAYIQNVPAGLSNDELDFVINSKAVFYRFSDISGQWNPLSMTTIPNEQAKSEFLYVLLAPFIGPFPFSILLAKTPAVLFNIMLVLVIYLIIERLVGKKEAFFTGLVSVFNPWMIFVGRTTFEAPIAIFFYFLVFYMLLVLKGWRLLFVSIFLFLAFTSYMGTKLIFLPFCFIVFFYFWYLFNKRKYFLQFLILFLFSLGLFSFFLYSSYNQHTGVRFSEIISSSNPDISRSVNIERTQSLTSPFSSLFTNKITILIHEVLLRYFDAFSTNLLFSRGDYAIIFALMNHGFFYYIDFFFILIGLYCLYLKNKQLFFLFVSILIIAPLPSALNNINQTYVFRSAFIFPILVIFSGIGFANLWYLKSKNFLLSRGIRIVLVLFYLISILNFFYLYFFRFTVYNQEAFAFSSRELAKYIALEKDQKIKIIVAASDPRSLFKQYIFYNNIYNKGNIDELAKDLKDNFFTYKNISFVNCKNIRSFDDAGIYVVSSEDICKHIVVRQIKRLDIAGLSDSGSMYKIYNDKFCWKYRLNGYISNLKLSDINLDRMGPDDFCTKYIIRYNN